MNLFAKLWADDAGIVYLEYLGLATILGLGLFIGAAAVEVALNDELFELGNAIKALSQGYSIATQSSCKVTKDGSQADDTSSTYSWSVGDPQAPTTDPSDIDVDACQ